MYTYHIINIIYTSKKPTFFCNFLIIDYRLKPKHTVVAKNQFSQDLSFHVGKRKLIKNFTLHPLTHIHRESLFFPPQDSQLVSHIHQIYNNKLD